MGILTDIDHEIDEDDEVVRVFATTKAALTDRSSLNRVASRVTLEAGVGQRTLVAAAYDELGIDMVWREGPFNVLAPEDKFEDAKQIDFRQKEIEIASEFGDILTPRLQDKVEYDEFLPREQVLNVWEIPFEVSDRR